MRCGAWPRRGWGVKRYDEKIRFDRWILLISAVAFAQEIDRSLLQGYDAAL